MFTLTTNEWIIKGANIVPDCRRFYSTVWWLRTKSIGIGLTRWKKNAMKVDLSAAFVFYYSWIRQFFVTYRYLPMLLFLQAIFTTAVDSGLEISTNSLFLLLCLSTSSGTSLAKFGPLTSMLNSLSTTFNHRWAMTGKNYKVTSSICSYFF